MTEAVARRLMWLSLFVLLGASGCHLDRTSYHQQGLSLSALPQLPMRFVDEDITQPPRTAAQTLMMRLEREAGIAITPIPSEPVTLPSPAPRLPPLPVRSHLSVTALISPQGDVTADFFITEPLPVTPDAPVLFTELDQFGSVLGFDMGLTDPHLPLAGTVNWPLSVQAVCVCPDTHTIYRTTDAEARLDFATGRFRMGAGFTGTNLTTAGIDLYLDRTSLLSRKGQHASTELSFTDRNPARLKGELHLYLSGREADHIGGQFSSTTMPTDLSDILFVMQFVSRQTAP